MTTLAHTAGSSATSNARRVGRAALYSAVDAAPESRPVPFRTRLRRPFSRREPTVKSLIRKYRLWPALEYSYDALVRELGSGRARAAVSGLEERFPYVWLDLRLPTRDVDLMLDLEDQLRGELADRFGDDVALRISLTINPDPDHLPLSD